MNDLSTQDERVMGIVSAALKLEADERDLYLKSACGADKQLYDEAAGAIQWEERMGGFLRHPMMAIRIPDSPFVSGEIISLRFEIIRKLGEGGMGVVYEAFDRKRNQPIAIKAAKPGFGRLLTPELEGALRVRHPNVCLVNEIHTAQTAVGEIDFLTMELLKGEPLSAVLSREGKLPATEAQEIARQLCSGLKEAHRSGVIHRDLKSANVILCRDTEGSVRAVITDFGLSGEAARPGFFGTQRYMAPELLLEQKATKASDIYALGIMLYEMVAGTKPREETEAGAESPQASPSYQRLVAEFLSLQPERRNRAFEMAQQELSRRSLSRRQLLGIGSGVIVALAGGGWMEGERIGNWLQPLPQKRFVALLAWPPDADQRVKSLIGGAIDAIESELARVESSDRNLFITSAPDVSFAGHEPGWLGKLGESLGVNLALQASGFPRSQGFTLLLKLLDVSTGAVLRQHQIVCSARELTALSVKAVQSAASLLNVHYSEQGVGRVKVSTDSAAAFQAFQAAEELRKKSNEDGLLAAIEEYKKAIDADPNYAAAYARLAMGYLRSHSLSRDAGVLELARANAVKAIQLDKNSGDGRLSLAMVYNAKGNYQAAQAEIRTASQLDPTNPKLLPWQATIYRHFHKWDLAEQAYRRLQKERPNYWVSYNELGLVLTDVGRFREAIDAFRVAAASAPGSALAFNNLGSLYFKRGQLAQAEENYRRSLALKPDELAYSNLGEVLRVERKYPEAISCYKNALRLTPSDDENWLGLGDCFEAMGGHEGEAVDAYKNAATEAEKLLDVDLNNQAILVRLALYRIKTHAPKDSMALLAKLKEGGHLDLDSELFRIRVLELAGKRPEALEAVASCLRRGPMQFEMKCARDLRGLVNDPRYAQILKQQTVQ